MKKILTFLIILLIIVVGILVGSYFIFQNEINIIKEEIGEDNVKDIPSKLYSIQFGGEEYAQLNDNTYLAKSNGINDLLDKIIKEKYNSEKMSEVEGIILYEPEDSSKIISVTKNNMGLITLFKIEEKSGQGVDFEIMFSKKKKQGAKKIIDANKLKDDYDFDYDVYTYNGNVDIKVRTRTKSLSDALKDGNITMDRIVEQAEKDASEGKITVEVYRDGGTKLYQYGTYTIIKCHTLDGNEDVYIGEFGMKFSDVIKEIDKIENEILIENSIKK